MRFLYRKTIELSTELELPVAGYDIKEAAERLTKSELDYVLKEAIFDSRSHQTYTVGTRTYEVQKTDKLISMEYGGPSVDELSDNQLGLYD